MRRTIHTRAPAGAVFDYLADFTNAEQWDPHTIAVTPVSGTGALGTEYHVISRFAGRTTGLTYRLTELRRPELIELRAAKKSLSAVDTITVAATASGAAVTYAVAFDFHGPLGLVEPLLRYPVRRLLDDGAARLGTVLDRLA